MEMLQTIAVALVTSSFVAAVANVLLGQWAISRQYRRDRYADIVGTLVARLELPYRIRRRTDDNAATLQELAERFHSNQEKLVADETWVAADSESVFTAWKSARAKLDPWFLEQSRQAWMQPPVAAGTHMNLHPPIPSPDVQVELEKLQNQISKATRLLRGG